MSSSPKAELGFAPTAQSTGAPLTTGAGVLAVFSPDSDSVEAALGNLSGFRRKEQKKRREGASDTLLDTGSYSRRTTVITECLPHAITLSSSQELIPLSLSTVPGGGCYLVHFREEEMEAPGG